MSSSLTADERAEYTRIIDGILATANLETVTRKKIRQGLEAAINKDLSDQKNAIKSLIEARFDAISSDAAQAIPTPPSGTAVEENDPSPEPSRTTSSDDADLNGDAADGEINVSTSPPAKKKQKRESVSDEDADAKLAAELQAQENRLSRARGPQTRGGGAAAAKKGKPKAKAKPAKKKSEKRVRGSDESDVEGDSDAGGEKKRKAGGGFSKPFNLSYPLAELCGTNQLSRPQVVKKLWEYIKGNELQDPRDKRQIICDEKLQAVFNQSKVNMFSMNKLLGNQLYPVDE